MSSARKRHNLRLTSFTITWIYFPKEKKSKFLLFFLLLQGDVKLREVLDVIIETQSYIVIVFYSSVILFIFDFLFSTSVAPAFISV